MYTIVPGENTQHFLLNFRLQATSRPLPGRFQATLNTSAHTPRKCTFCLCVDGESRRVLGLWHQTQSGCQNTAKKGGGAPRRTGVLNPGSPDHGSPVESRFARRTLNQGDSLPAAPRTAPTPRFKKNVMPKKSPARRPHAENFGVTLPVFVVPPAPKKFEVPHERGLQWWKTRFPYTYMPPARGPKTDNRPLWNPGNPNFLYIFAKSRGRRLTVGPLLGCDTSLSWGKTTYSYITNLISKSGSFGGARSRKCSWGVGFPAQQVGASRRPRPGQYQVSK